MNGVPGVPLATVIPFEVVTVESPKWQSAAALFWIAIQENGKGEALIAVAPVPRVTEMIFMP